MAQELSLVIGNKRLSSWSLRPWLLLVHAGIAFQEVLVPFHLPDWAARVRARSPAGKVPALIDGDLTIWESLAICESLAERFPDAKLWPADARARAIARCASAEMHAGFSDLRRECPMDVVRKPGPRAISDRASSDVARVIALWATCRGAFGGGGPFLFGDFSIADAMFAPVATRIVTYALPVDPMARAYVDTIYALPAMQRWFAEAAHERFPAEDPGRGHGAVLSRAEAETFARQWVTAWSRRDLEAVMAPYADDATFRSPRAVALTGAAEVIGKPALRAYWAAALARRPDLRFELDDWVYDLDANTLLVRYWSHGAGDRHRAAELMTFGADGRIARGEALYGDQIK
jgi:glutathione S-transferase